MANKLMSRLYFNGAISAWFLLIFLSLTTLLNAQNGVTKKTTTPTWTSDNGNGTFTNPLFYDEFSDPDLIRVGNDYYLTGKQQLFCSQMWYAN